MTTKATIDGRAVAQDRMVQPGCLYPLATMESILGHNAELRAIANAKAAQIFQQGGTSQDLNNLIAQLGDLNIKVRLGTPVRGNSPAARSNCIIGAFEVNWVYHYYRSYLSGIILPVRRLRQYHRTGFEIIR